MDGGMVFILGAGASSGAGAPVMRTFFQKAKHFYRKKRLGDFTLDYKAVEHVRHMLSRAKIKSKLDIDNLEDIYTALETVEIIGGIDGISEKEAINYKKSLDNLISIVLQESIEFPIIRKKGEVFLSPTDTYDKLVAEAEFVRQKYPGYPINFISFNYDLALDFALKCQKNLKFSYCLDDKLENSRKVINYCKLHGSLNWGYDKINERVVLADLDFSKIEKHYDLYMRDKITIKVDDLIYESIDENVDFPLIIPPTNSKIRKHRLLKPVWKSAAHSLKKAEIIVVIGYSFPSSDQFFKNFFALSTIGSSSLDKILIIDPSKHAKENFKEILNIDLHRRVEHIQEKFDDSLHIIRECIDEYLEEWG